MATEQRGWEPQPPIHGAQEETQNPPAELCKGQDTQCCQPRWQLGHHTSGWAPPPSPPARNTQQDPRKTSKVHFPSASPRKQSSFSCSKNPSQLLAWSRKFQHTWRFGIHSGVWEVLGTNPSLKFPSESSDPEGRGSGGGSAPPGEGLGGTKGPFATSEGHGQKKTPPAWSQILHWMGARCCPSHSWPFILAISSQEPPGPSHRAGAPQKPL